MDDTEEGKSERKVAEKDIVMDSKQHLIVMLQSNYLNSLCSSSDRTIVDLLFIKEPIYCFFSGVACQLLLLLLPFTINAYKTVSHYEFSPLSTLFGRWELNTSIYANFLFVAGSYGYHHLRSRHVIIVKSEPSKLGHN